MDKQALLAEIRDFYEGSRKREIPEGCITFADIRREFGCGVQKAQRIAVEMLESGKWERLDIPWKGGKLACFRKIA